VTPGDVTTVELGTRRKWLGVVALGAVAAGAGVALTGGDAEEAQPPTSTSSSTTTSSSVVVEAPLLGQTTGWQLVLSPNGVVSQIVDLDSGELRAVNFGAMAAVGDGGIVTSSSDGRLFWRPAPFDDDTAVPLSAGRSRVVPVPGQSQVWVVDVGPSTESGIRLLSLDTGAVVREPSIGTLSSVVGLVGTSLVVAGGGDAFVVGVDGAVGRIADGSPFGVLGDRVLVSRCDDDLDCNAVAVDPATGEDEPVPGFGQAPWEQIGPSHPVGGILVHVPNGGVLVLTPDGDLRGLPEPVEVGAVHGAAWTPDGSRLLVPAGQGEVLVIDPVAPGGATVVTSLRLGNGPGTALAVVGPPSQG
jgi:hypothetical protein